MIADRLPGDRRQIAGAQRLEQREQLVEPLAGSGRVPARRLLQELDEPAAAVRPTLGTVRVADEALQRADRDRLVEVSAPAGDLAGGAADAAADRRERVGAARDQVGELVVPARDRADVAAGVGVHRTGVLALDLLLPVGAIGCADRQEVIVHRPIPSSRGKPLVLAWRVSCARLRLRSA